MSATSARITAGIPQFVFDRAARAAAVAWASQAMTGTVPPGAVPLPDGIDPDWALSGENADPDLNALVTAAAAAGILTCTGDAGLSIGVQPPDGDYKHASWHVEVTPPARPPQAHSARRSACLVRGRGCQARHGRRERGQRPQHDLR